MAEPPASPPESATTAAAATTKITDLDEDSLAHCATYLSLQDLSNLAMTSKFLKKVAYSDPIWLHRFRERWPLEMLSSSSSGVRKAYLDWRTALHQLKFADPFVLDLYTEARHFDHLLLDKNDIIFSQVRVWDTATSSAIRSSCCVGMTSVPGSPVDMKCHEALIYVAAGSSVVVVDLRTMQKVNTAAIYQPKLYSFAIMPSKSLVCTGGFGKAMLWDIRRNQETSKPEPVTELDGHMGSVTLLHMDPYKIVTGGLGDNFVNAWETYTGTKTNSLLCNRPELGSTHIGCSAMAINACKIVTASYGETQGLVRFRDFSSATRPILEDDDDDGGDVSKFWGTQSYSDSDRSDE